MANKEFKSLIDLIESRQNLARVLKENNIAINNILAGLYNDPSHFIYEILQNAEDAGAKEIRFELFKDKLDIHHNGRDFNLKDIEGVTGYGISTKKDDLNLIGKFGVGFKSVFAITETPLIFSGEYSIKIEDFVVPSIINDSEQINKTLISLLFNHKSRSQEQVFTLIAKKLENLGSKTLLFLKNIEEINWQTPFKSGHYLKASENFQKEPNVKKVTIVSSSVSEKFIVIERPIKIESENLKVEVAYKLVKDEYGDEYDKEIIVSEPDSKLVVFLPTEKVTFLNFIIQGPYKTTPSRENIPLEDEQNKTIIEETGNLVAESLSVIKDLGYLDTNFLALLPIDLKYKREEQIYSVIYDKVKERLLSEELLPTTDGKYTRAKDALLARGKELTEFLDKNDIQELFFKQDWLDTSITYDRNRELRDYLVNELNIVEVDFKSFAGKITADFLKTKSDEWMIDFYSRLLGQPSLWEDKGYEYATKGVLRTKPLIRLENGEHIAPFNDTGKVQAYLPTGTKSKYKIVKRILTEDENSLKFLKKLGLTKPDLLAEVEEFILPKYQMENPAKDEEYFEDFEKLLKSYETISRDKKEEFKKELLEASFIDSVKNDTGEHYLRKLSEAYFKKDDFEEYDLVDYFDGYHSVYFVSDELYENFEKEKLQEFLTDLGMEDKPRRIEIPGNLTWEEKYKLRELQGDTRRTKDIYQKDYEYEGLDNFITHITINKSYNKSYLLWKLLLRNIENLNSLAAEEFFKGRYCWSYHSERLPVSFEASFVRILKQQWLVDKNNNFKKPSDIIVSDLSDNYIKDAPNIDILIKVLEFKPEIIDQLPESDRKILEIVKRSGLSTEELEKLISESKKEFPNKEEKIWVPEVNPDEVDIKIVEVVPEIIVTSDLTGQGKQIDIGKDVESIDKIAKSKKADIHTPIDIKAIGDCGEKHVYRALKKKYQEQGDLLETDSGFKIVNAENEEFKIIWLNKNHNVGKGCDFVVKKNGAEIEYIEVKTKIQEDPELIGVTGTQWEFARKLYNHDEGDKYYFYVVLNAGKENAQIHIYKNPIKLWKEGKLYAHPVNFKL